MGVTRKLIAYNNRALGNVSQIETSVHAGMTNQCHVAALHALPSSGRATLSHCLMGPGSPRKLAALWKNSPEPPDHQLTDAPRLFPPSPILLNSDFPRVMMR